MQKMMPLDCTLVTIKHSLGIKSLNLIIVYRLGARLELISRRILNDSTSHALSNLVIDSLDLGNILSKESGTCKVFFGTSLHSKLPGVYCKPIRREVRSDFRRKIT